MILIGIGLITAGSAQAYSHGNTIDRNYNSLRQNKLYQEKEKKHSRNLDKAKDRLFKAIGNHKRSYNEMVSAQAEVDQLENNTPAHRRYQSDWSYGGTSLTYKRTR